MSKICNLYVGEEAGMGGLEAMAIHYEPEFLEYKGERLVAQKVKWSGSGTYDILVPGFLKKETDDSKAYSPTPTSICLKVEEIPKELQPDIKGFLESQGYKGNFIFSTY